MKNIKILSSLVLAASITLVSVNAMSGNYSTGDDHKSHSSKGNAEKGNMIKKMMRHMSKLDLSEEQKNQIKLIIKSGIEDSKAQKDAISQLKKQMKELKNAEELDESAFKALFAEISVIKSDLMIMHINKRKQVAALLTDEQKKSFMEMKHERKNRRSK